MSHEQTVPWRQEPRANGEGWPPSALARVGLYSPDASFLSHLGFTALAAGMGSREVELWMDLVMGPDLRVLLEPESTIEAKADAGRRAARPAIAFFLLSRARPAACCASRGPRCPAARACDPLFIVSLLS